MSLPASQDQEPVKAISKEEIPQFVKDLPSDTLLFFSVNAGEISAGKSIGMGVLTGVLTAALTGGMVIASSAAVSGTEIDVIAFDKNVGDVVCINSDLRA